MDENKNIQFSTIDYILIAIVFFLLISSWVYTIIYYTNLPDIIATHFDGLGKPNGYNSKKTIWLVLTFLTLLSTGFILGSKYQNLINSPKRKLSSHQENSNLKTMLFSALLIALIAPLIIYSMVEAALSKNFEMPWVTPVILGVVLIYLIAIFYQKIKTSKL